MRRLNTLRESTQNFVHENGSITTHYTFLSLKHSFSAEEYVI